MLSIHKTIKSTPSSVSFERLKERILGKKYVLSLVFIGDYKSRTLNSRYRGKDSRANVLSFPMDKDEGEIYINPSAAKRDCRKFGLTKPQMIALLFIHGMLHLKGIRHGKEMEKVEKHVLHQHFRTN